MASRGTTAKAKGKNTVVYMRFEAPGHADPPRVRVRVRVRVRG